MFYLSKLEIKYDKKCATNTWQWLGGTVDAADLQRLGDYWHQTNSGKFTFSSDARFFNYNKNISGGRQIIDAADFQVFGDCWHNGVAPP